MRPGNNNAKSWKTSQYRDEIKRGMLTARETPKRVGEKKPCHAKLANVKQDIATLHHERLLTLSK